MDGEGWLLAGCDHNISRHGMLLCLFVVVLAVAGCLHWPSGVLHDASYRMNLSDIVLHNRAGGLHNRAGGLHKRAGGLHNRAVRLRKRAGGLHNRAGGLHKRAGGLHNWGYPCSERLCEIFGGDGFPVLEGAGEVVAEWEAEVDESLGDDVGGRGGFADADGVDG